MKYAKKNLDIETKYKNLKLEYDIIQKTYLSIKTKIKVDFKTNLLDELKFKNLDEKIKLLKEYEQKTINDINIILSKELIKIDEYKLIILGENLDIIQDILTKL